MSELKEISFSRIQVFRNCRRKYYYRYILNKEAKVPQFPLSFGKIVHQALYEYHLGNKDILNCVEKAKNDFLNAYPDYNLERVDYEIGLILGVLSAYLEIFPSFDYIEPEKEIRLPLDGIEIVGRVDGLIQEGNKWWILEHKTIGSTSVIDFQKRLQLDDQPTLYMYALRGYDVCGVLYNLIRRPRFVKYPQENYKQFAERIKGKILRDPSMYFSRFKIYRTLRGIKEFEKELLYLIHTIRECHKHPDRLEVFYKNPYYCSSYLECEYRPLCVFGISDRLLEMLYKDREEEK